jgi:cation:H+ antiporter
MFDFTQLNLLINLGIFAVAAAAVWIAGTRMSNYGDAIIRTSGLGEALTGLIVIALVTSLPEIGVTVTAAFRGNANLAVNNLFGSVAMQLAALAVIDFVIGRRALTTMVPDPNLLLLGALNVLLLAFAAAGMVVGDIAFIGIGLWAWGCLFAYVFALWLLSNSTGRRPWIARENADESNDEPRGEAKSAESKDGLKPIILPAIAAAATILVAGYVLSGTGEAIAEQTGLGSSFVGFVLVAISTSLPEFSSALQAARLGRFSMAISGILGTNMLNVALLFVVDLVSSGPPAMNVIGPFAQFGAILGVVITALFLIGVAERRDRTFFRLGVDSAAVLIAYLGGLIVLYSLR